MNRIIDYIKNYNDQGLITFLDNQIALLDDTEKVDGDFLVTLVDFYCKYDEDQPRDDHGRFGSSGGSSIEQNSAAAAYDNFKKETTSIFKKAEKQRNSGIRIISLTTEEQALYNHAVHKLEVARTAYYKDNGLDDAQIGFLKEVGNEWVQGSNNESSLIVKSVVAELNGTDFSKEHNFKEDSMKPISGIEYYKRFIEIKTAREKQVGGKEKLIAAVKTEMAYNQAMFKADNPKGLEVYRGDRNENIKPGTVNVKVSTLTSFSTNLVVAENFARGTGSILTYKMQSKDVMFYYKANPSVLKSNLGLAESEVVAMTKNQSIKVNASKPKKSTKQVASIENSDFEDYLRENS